MFAWRKLVKPMETTPVSVLTLSTVDALQVSMPRILRSCSWSNWGTGEVWRSFWLLLKWKSGERTMWESLILMQLCSDLQNSTCLSSLFSKATPGYRFASVPHVGDEWPIRVRPGPGFEAVWVCSIHWLIIFPIFPWYFPIQTPIWLVYPVYRMFRHTHCQHKPRFPRHFVPRNDEDSAFMAS